MLTWKETGQLLILLALGGLLGLGAGYLSVRAEGRTPPTLPALLRPAVR